MEKVCDKFLIDNGACNNFVERQECLSLKAKKRAKERNTFPTTDWNDEQEVRLLTAKQLKLFLKHCLPVYGGKEVLIIGSY